jgi:hypothetical protein
MPKPTMTQIAIKGTVIWLIIFGSLAWTHWDDMLSHPLTSIAATVFGTMMIIAALLLPQHFPSHRLFRK